ncbi:uncharacterized protein TNCV_2063971 [Trichonephila clavipes]|nr:uncharacterized protein TNCV_2063971 [Trichonephila clavipes]
MILEQNRRCEQLFIRDENPFQAKVQLLFAKIHPSFNWYSNPSSLVYKSSVTSTMAAVAEWYRYRTVACFVTGSSPVPLKTRRVGQRCTLNLSRAETSSRWCGVVVRRGGASSGIVHVT